MAESNARTSEMRTGKDQNGFGQNRQGKAYSGQNQRRPRYAPPNARVQGKPMETQAKRGGGKEAAVSWEVRCPDLLKVAWMRFSGPPCEFKAARLYAENLDHDEARPIAWGKNVMVEIRRIGSNAIIRLEVKGEIQYRYHVSAVS
jgi:hypothetical protein